MTMTDTQDMQKKLAVHLGTTLREARRKAELTQDDVAERIGIVGAVLGRMERGHCLPSVPTLRRICDVLRVDPNALLGLDTGKSPPWLEESPGEEDDVPELRRLLRVLRKMNAAHLAVVSSTVHALVRYAEAPRRGDSTRAS